MGYKKWQADQVFDGHQFIKDKVLVAKEDGSIEGLVDVSDAGDDVMVLEGTISPGLINCHCHLELSHLKNVIPPHTGLIEFLCSVVTKRDFPVEQVQEEIAKAEKEMAENGIMAVGDIGNTADTAAIKSRSKIRWQNFVEVLSFTDQQAEQNIRHYSEVARQMETKLAGSDVPHRTALVPHAPYSISPKTFQLINALTQNRVISLHNQEHPAENDLYRTGGGEYLRLFKIFGLESSPFPVTGMSSIRSVLPYFNNGQTILLVHNTSMEEEDIIWANAYARSNGISLYYCLCINANLYIEDKVPPVDLLIRHGCRIVLGTDSYSSNWQLSIASEMQSFHKHFPHIKPESLFQWATLQGANALGWNQDLGAFDFASPQGKRPGVVLVDRDFSRSVRLA